MMVQSGCSALPSGLCVAENYAWKWDNRRQKKQTTCRMVTAKNGASIGLKKPSCIAPVPALLTVCACHVEITLKNDAMV